ncbi:syntenin-1-like [Episyrphus balteatus]|uniref:syntenin-1-like n=1 Tax=Episyrphus balteatus TaxID=286459 RepID=UPI002485E2AC|nr:syntenin-1-like [Episyrphus balteatus]XP_055837390.1 syntenin-1-like [Episyrphus balteatus]XP_055837468.1 syntenin-1-like [Episyrphus balteatus]
MSLYPSLEDMQVDKLVQNQRAMVNEVIKFSQDSPTPTPAVTATPSPYPVANVQNGSVVYPALGNFLGLELSDDMIRQNMPEYMTDVPDTAIEPAKIPQYPSTNGIVAPVTGNSLIPAVAQVNHSIRELILCKDSKGKIGLRVQSIDNGVFVCIVVKNSPAALAGLRFGDQILQINGTLVCGYSVDKIHKMLKSSGSNNISVVVRDRPFERTVTLLKDSKGNMGIVFKNGKITSIVKDSSAAKNGVLINHNLLEVNGQTVVAMKDKEITKIITDAPGSTIKITIIPTFLFEHLVKKLSTSFLRGKMDHSIPEF